MDKCMKRTLMLLIVLYHHGSFFWHLCLDVSLSWVTAYLISSKATPYFLFFHLWVFLYLTKVLPLTWASPKTCLPLHVFIPTVNSFNHFKPEWTTLISGSGAWGAKILKNTSSRRNPSIHWWVLVNFLVSYGLSFLSYVFILPYFFLKNHYPNYDG